MKIHNFPHTHAASGVQNFKYICSGCLNCVYGLVSVSSLVFYGF